MELATGTKIVYTSAAGTRQAEVVGIKIAPTARPGFLMTWITLLIPVQKGVKFATQLVIPGDNASLKMFRVQTA
jgi:hypothetical protein